MRGFYLLWLLFYAATASAEHDWGDTRATVDQAAVAAEGKRAAHQISRGSTVEPSLLQQKCLDCHSRQETKVVTYTMTVNGETSTEQVTIDFTELSATLTEWLANPEAALAASPLDKATAYRWLTMFHRMGIHMKGTAEERQAVASLRRWVVATTQLSDSVIDTYLEYRAPFPDIELRRRVTQVFGDPAQPAPEGAREKFLELGEAVGVPRTEMENWIQLAPRTTLTADKSR